MKPPLLILTCEHAGKRIPPEWRQKVAIPEDVLASHRGWDPGAWTLTQALKACGAAHVFAYHESRLLIELNRSLHHPKLFSEFSKPLSASDKLLLTHSLYEPYRRQVTEVIQSYIRQRRRVCHVSVHSFTPALDGVERQAEVGLLYDPRRSNERFFCAEWRSLLQRSSSNNLFRVRMNYPYKGTADGFITSLRKIFSNSYYIGIELEVNQGILASAKARQPVTVALLQSLKALIDGRGT